MEHRIPTRTKMQLALGLNAFFYAVLMYVNLNGEDRSWGAIFGKNFGILLSEYLVGSAIIFGWLFLAERIHEQFEGWFGEEIISKGGILPNAAAILTFAAANLVVNHFAIQFIYWLQTLTLERADNSIVADGEYARMSVRFAYVNYIIMALFVYYLLTHRRIMQRMGEAALRAEKAQKVRIESQYALLRSRVNPHFLFNSLSTLSSLVQVDGELSEQFIDRLSRAYRYMLEHRDRQTVSLKTELEFLTAYAFLLETRFGNKFRIKTTVPAAAAEQRWLVPLTLQVIVDGAIKSNRMSAQSPLVIRVAMEAGNLQVWYNCQSRTEPDTTIGDWDWNLFETQYAALYPDGRMIRKACDETTCTVVIPLLDQPETISTATTAYA